MNLTQKLLVLLAIVIVVLMAPPLVWYGDLETTVPNMTMVAIATAVCCWVGRNTTTNGSNHAAD
jgi:hypothetical protein